MMARSMRNLALYRLPFIHRNNCFVGILGKVTWPLTRVFEHPLGDVAFTEGRLQEQVPCVAVVAENLCNGLRMPNATQCL